MGRQSAELAQAKADEAWWREFGEPLGLMVIGWTYRHTASFTPDDPTKPGWGVVQVTVGDALHRLLSRLRAVIIEPAP